MKKIGLFLGTQPSAGGAFQYCQAMLEAFTSLPMSEFTKVIVFSCDDWREKLVEFKIPNQSIENTLWGKFFEKILNLINLPIKWDRRMYALFHPIARVLLRQKCDLWIFPAAEPWSYQIPVCALVTIYDLMHRYERRFPEISANGVFEWREKHYSKMSKSVNGIFVDSEVSRLQLIESYGRDPSSIYILPYIAPKYIYNELTPVGFDQRYKGLGKYIFYPAQFWEHKNHKGLIQAVGLLKEKYPDLKLVFVGSKKNGYLSTFKLVKQLNVSENIKFLGYVPDSDMSQLYRRSQGMIMPTFLGPTNIPPLEANAVGCPLAVSDVYAMPEQIGNAAIYFNPSSVQGIADAIEKLWTDDDLCSKLRERGLERNSQHLQFHFNEIFIKAVRIVQPEVHRLSRELS